MELKVYQGHNNIKKSYFIANINGGYNSYWLLIPAQPKKNFPYL
jgi:hypothetical protein